MNDEVTAQIVKKEVEQHLRDKELIEHSLPSSIVIGPFFICVEAVRKALSDKKKTLANAVLELFAQKLRKQVEDVSYLFEDTVCTVRALSFYFYKNYRSHTLACLSTCLMFLCCVFAGM